MKKDRKNYFEDVGQYYNDHQKDINLLLGEKDKIVHHHSGICNPESVFPNMNEENLLTILHEQETALTLKGVEYLGQLTPKMKGLDAGCGRGGSSFLVNKLWKCSMEGISLSSYQVSFANKTARELGIANKVKFYQANMLNLPFDDASFNFIWACESTEHIPDLGAMFTEFARISRQNARLVIIAGCSNPDNPQAQEYLTAETIPYWHLRERSVYKTGVEKFVEGYECGAAEYRLFSFRRI